MLRSARTCNVCEVAACPPCITINILCAPCRRTFLQDTDIAQKRAPYQRQQIIVGPYRTVDRWRHWGDSSDCHIKWLAGMGMGRYNLHRQRGGWSHPSANVCQSCSCEDRIPPNLCLATGWSATGVNKAANLIVAKSTRRPQQIYSRMQLLDEKTP